MGFIRNYSFWQNEQIKMYTRIQVMVVAKGR